MGTLLALYWSVPSVYTNSVARAYWRPLRGLDGAGDGGRSWPSRSTFRRALFKAFILLSEFVDICAEVEELDSDISEEGRGSHSGRRDKLDDLQR